jgi:hypothetical protein
MPGTAVTQLNVGFPSVPPAVLASGLHPYVTEVQPVVICRTPSQPGTYNLQVLLLVSQMHSVYQSFLLIF